MEIMTDHDFCPECRTIDGDCECNKCEKCDQRMDYCNCEDDDDDDEDEDEE